MTVPSAPPSSRIEPWQRRFSELLPFRVREILLVSSPYDAFVLEEDGSLSDRLFRQYTELSLSQVPRITHAASGEDAFRLLEDRRFDLVITVVRVGDIDAVALSERVKHHHPDLLVVLLLFDETDLSQLPTREPPRTIDRVFQWTGSAEVLTAMIKSLEDMRNAAHDTETAGVQVILVVEDGVRAYSSLLSVLYPLLLQQAGSLIAEGFNDFHRMLRLRARPKILLANDYEEAMSVFEAFERYMLAIITDVRLPREGALTRDAGLRLAESIRGQRPDLSIVLQTAEPMEREASRLRAWYIDKNAPDFRSRIRRFFEEALGFGDFVFRLPDGTEVGRARDVFEMERVLAKMPAESVRYHAAHNHFSVWLTARSLFALAQRIRPQRIDDYDDIEHLRRDLVALLREARMHEQESVITDLSTRLSGPEGRFVRIGRGSIGGKGRSIAFVSSLIVRHRLLERFEGLQVRIPKTVVLGTDAFDGFMELVDLGALLEAGDDAELTRRLTREQLSDDVLADLRRAFDGLKGPLAVRSSSLLEDSRFQPFAGVYATYMLPNNHPDPEERFEQLQNAIKAVYASTFWRSAQRYLAGTPHETEDQKMAVVIQQVVGRDFGTRFYPPISGVAQSYNHYPIGGQRPADGVAHLCLGLGQQVVSGGVALRVSPGAPTALPQFPSAASFADGSQHQFYAIDLSRTEVDPTEAPDSSLLLCDLDAAEQDGSLALVGSVYVPEDDVLRESFRHAGPRVVTFANVLRWKSLPLAEALRDVLALLRKNMGEEVEIEFAVDAPVPGLPDAPDEARLYVLQVRPHVAPELRPLGKSLEELDDDLLIARTDQALGHGRIGGVRDVVQVCADRLDASGGKAIAREVAELDEALRGRDRPYLLVGPGRWGSVDPTLGVAVEWGDIRGARAIVETPIGERRIEPSHGTHFFRNITAARVAYLTVTGTSDSWIDGAALDAWWRAQGGDPEACVRHIALERPLEIYVDGRKSRSAILQAPSPAEP